MLHGSLRKRSFSRLLTEEAARILHRFGAETRSFNPSGLPRPDDDAVLGVDETGFLKQGKSS